MTPQLPEVPAALVTACVDPGVISIKTVADAVSAIGAQRVYAACANKKWRDLLKFYRGVQSGFSG